MVAASVLSVVLQSGGVSAPVQVLFEKASKYFEEQTALITSADKEYQKLRRILEIVRAMIDAVENKCLCSTHNSAAWRIWLRDAEALCYAADDVVDDIIVELRKKCAAGVEVNEENEVRDTILSSLDVGLANRITEIKSDLENIAREIDLLSKSSRSGFPSILDGSIRRARTSFLDESSVIGFEEIKKKIIHKLMDESTNKFDVIPIVGMGGSGKTTLAQMIYNEDSLGVFDIKLWACVSINFDVIRVTKSIVESADGKVSKLCDLHSLQSKLRHLIDGKRFLLVLDDYWTEDYNDWKCLSAPFRFGDVGSKILLTSRSLTVSRVITCNEAFIPKTLTNEECWLLMKQKTSSNFLLRWELTEIGKNFAWKCRGLPLAAVTFGAKLRSKENPREWISILNSDMWETADNDVLSVLLLSYFSLPPHLKKCFKYCAIFPDDHKFTVKELVSLWIGEGLVLPCGNMQTEDIAEDYFKCLFQKSFFQMANSVNSEYKMHHFIHSMARMISAPNHLHVSYEPPEENDHIYYRNTHHVAFSFPSEHHRVLDGCIWFKNLRTLKLINPNDGKKKIELSKNLFEKLESLRVLDLSHMELDELPDTFEFFKRLQYLNLSHNNIEQLPETITTVSSLVTLNLDKCGALSVLPSKMKNMVSLEDLYFDKNTLQRLPADFGKLVNLKSLSAFLVGTSKEEGIGQLQYMNLLSGGLCIKNLGKVKSHEAAKEAKLDLKPFLQTLELQWNDLEEAIVHQAEVLHGLQPHDNLKELVIVNYQDIIFPSWFRKVSNMRLVSCKLSGILTSIVSFQHLKILVLEKMHEWSEVNKQFSGFLCLETLKIMDMQNLTSWEQHEGSRFPSLHSLVFNKCPSLINLPSLVNTMCLYSLIICSCPLVHTLPDDGLPQSLEEVSISESALLEKRCNKNGEDWDLLKSVPRIVINNEIISGRL